MANADLIRRADHFFRLRLRYIWGAPDMIACYSCQRWVPASEIEVGHIFSRRYYRTRWLEENAVPQCKTCNQNENVSDRLDAAAYERLAALAHDPHFRLTKDFILNVIDKYEGIC